MQKNILEARSIVNGEMIFLQSLEGIYLIKSLRRKPAILVIPVNLFTLGNYKVGTNKQEDMKEYKILCMHHELNLEFFVFLKKWEGQEKVEVQTLKELQVEKEDMHCNYRQMPYLEKHFEANLQC